MKITALQQHEMKKKKNWLYTEKLYFQKHKIKIHVCDYSTEDQKYSSV